MSSPDAKTPEQIELVRAEQTFLDVLNVLPLSEAAKRSITAAASSWAKAASITAAEK